MVARILLLVVLIVCRSEAILFGVGIESVHADIYNDPGVTYVKAFSSKTYTLGGSQAIKVPDNSLNVNSTNSRRLLAELLSEVMSIEAGQPYVFGFSGYSCIKFSVTSSPEDLHVMLMDENSYVTLSANSYIGAYVYVKGSKCEQTYRCAKTISGLSSSKTYYLVVINDYDGLFDGEDAKTQVLVETCSSNPSSSQGSRNNGSSNAGLVIGLLALFIIITACAYRNKCCCFQSNPHLFPVTAMQVPTIVQQPAVVSGAAMQVPTFVIQRQPIVAGRHENTIRTARGILRGLSAVQDLDL